MEDRRDRPKVDVTEGNVLKSVLYMGIPSMIGFGAMTIYGLTDIYWVGRLGTAPVAAITLFGAIAWVLGSANQIVGTGSVALISRRFGERDYEATRDVIRQTVLLKVLVAMVMGGAGLLLTPRILGLMGAEPAAYGHALAYSRIYFYGLPFMFTSYTIYTALRGVGDAPKAMYIMLLSTGLNVALDPVFIFVLGLGVRGAAMATVISAAVAVATGFVVLASGRANITVRVLRAFHPKFATMLSIVGIGGPAGLNGIMRSVAHWLVTTLVATFGTVVVAAYGLGIRIMELGILFGVGLQLGASALVGQNLGARKKDRAHEAVVKATFLVMALTGVLGIVEFIFAEQILGFFTEDTAVIESGRLLVRLFAFAQVWIAMHITMSSAFWGSGNTWPPTVITAVIEWGVQIPLILLVIHVIKTSEAGVWWAMFAASCVEVLLTFLWFRRGHWKHKEV
ncbi:MAG: MATE family efflux transporter [Candidatus Eisenbacteria bacterium]|nr:MATE family efflux transporter [Candidatus Eisenbacteria bacterium]